MIKTYGKKVKVIILNLKNFFFLFKDLVDIGMD